MTTSDGTATPGTLTVQIPGPAGLLPGWSVLIDGRPVPPDRPMPVRDGTDPSPSARVEVQFLLHDPAHRLDARIRADVPVPRGAAVRLQMPVESLLPVILAAVARRHRPERRPAGGLLDDDLLGAVLGSLPLP